MEEWRSAYGTVSADNPAASMIAAQGRLSSDAEFHGPRSKISHFMDLV
jgi:hypothetical protein